MCIPGPWQVIQDMTHLSLALGMISLVVMGVVEVVEFAKWESHKDLYCKFASVVLLLVLLFLYLARIIGRYDQSIADREKVIKEQRAELIHGYEDLVQDIDGMLNRATESTQSLAESEFNSKRNDFIRFLDRIEDRFSTTAQVGTDAERAEIFGNFKRFVLMWLKLYEECSLDPIDKPFRVVDLALLEGKETIPQLVQALKAEIKAKGQVYFSKEIDQSKKEIDGKRATIQRMSQPMLPLSWTPEKAAAANSIREIELSSDVRFHASDPDSDSDVEAPRSHRTASGREVFARPAKKDEPQSRLPCRWLKCGKSTCGPCCCGGGLPRPFPRSFGCLCGSVVFLSVEHIKLMFGFCVSLFLLGTTIFQVFQIGMAHIKGEEHHNIYAMLIFLPSIFLLQALIYMLAWFEQIDIIQRMELELQQLQKDSDDLAHKKEEMVEYWEQVQAITDIWVYRVTPRLFLYKEVQACLEDLRKPSEFNRGLQVATTAIQALESQLPALTHWRADGTISEADKKTFDKRLKHISNNVQDLDTVVSNLQRLCKARDAIPRRSLGSLNGAASFGSLSST